MRKVLIFLLLVALSFSVQAAEIDEPDINKEENQDAEELETENAAEESLEYDEEYDEDYENDEEKEKCADGENYECASKVDVYDEEVEYIEITIGSYPRDDRDRYSITLLIRNNEDMQLFGNFSRCAVSEMFGARPSEYIKYEKMTAKQKTNLMYKQLAKYELADCKNDKCASTFNKIYKTPYLTKDTKNDILKIAKNYDYDIWKFFYEKVTLTRQYLQSTDDAVLIDEREEKIERIHLLYEQICSNYVMKKEIFDANKKIIKKAILVKLGISSDIIEQINSLGVVE